jgi:sugar transferase (PEP-CTERM system associated)
MPKLGYRKTGAKRRSPPLYLDSPALAVFCKRLTPEGVNMLKVFEHHVPMATVLELLADGLLCFLAVLVAAMLLPMGVFTSRGVPMPLSQLLLPAAAFAAFMGLLYSFFGLYRRGAIVVSPKALLCRALLAVAMGSCVAYLALEAEGSSRYALPLLVSAVPLMLVGAAMVRGFVFLARRASVGARRVLIVGTGPEAQGVARDLSAGGSTRHTVVGYYPAGAESALEGGSGSGTLFTSSLTIDQIVQRHKVDEVIVAVREQRGGTVPMDQLLACRIRGIPVLDLAGFFERAKGEVPTESLKASWLVYGHGFVQGNLRTASKRVFDLVASALLLVVASPLMLLTAIAVRLESPGPVIYRQERVGLGGRSFMCLKFRSMRNDAERDGVARWATKNDARVTRVGKFIRKCRIDELPQLFSVLRGEMSLVGPRPERPSFVSQLQAQIPFYDIRHSVKPGVTGWAQVRYSYGATVEDARRKHQFDLYYVKNNSLFLDLLVLVETVSVVLFREGAH